MAGSRARSVASATLLGIAAMTAGASPAAAATPLPAHVYAPYFETWTTDSISTVSQQSGVRHFTLAFLQTTSKSSCTLAWNGVKTQTVAAGRYLADIAALRANGGDVIPSLGGWSADQGGTEIGDSCKDVSQIVAAYQALVTTYDVSRIDMDIEGRSLTRSGRHRPAQPGDRAAAGVGDQHRAPAHDLVHAADERVGPRGERPRRPPERRAARRSHRPRAADGVRLLRPHDDRHGRGRGRRAHRAPRPAAHAPARRRPTPSCGRSRGRRS